MASAEPNRGPDRPDHKRGDWADFRNGLGYLSFLQRPDQLSSLKIDHSIDANDTLTGRYFFGDSIQSFPLALTATGGQLPGFNTFTPTRVQLVSISYTRTIGSAQVNELPPRLEPFCRGVLPCRPELQPQFDWPVRRNHRYRTHGLQWRSQ
jgi:hypothetical protein